MCGRSSLTKTEKEIELRFNATFYSEELERYNPLPNYNIAPTHMHPVISMQNKDHIQIFRWGLIPFWAKDKSIGSKMINARVETLGIKSAFKNLLQSKRCLVPLDGFYEWKTIGKQKIPYRILTTNMDIFCVAGLWDTWKDPATGEITHSFTIITVPPNEIMQNIHDRMPAILLKEHESIWVDESIHFKDMDTILLPYPSDLIQVYKVSTKVNNVKINDPSLIEPIHDTPQPFQTTLF